MQWQRKGELERLDSSPQTLKSDIMNCIRKDVYSLIEQSNTPIEQSNTLIGPKLMEKQYISFKCKQAHKNALRCYLRASIFSKFSWGHAPSPPNFFLLSPPLICIKLYNITCSVTLSHGSRPIFLNAYFGALKNGSKKLTVELLF